MITPIFCLSDDNIDRLHVNLMRSIVFEGKDLKFGDKTEVKMAREGCFISVETVRKMASKSSFLLW